MEITVFAKKRTKKDGGTFRGYLATLEKKDGTKQTVIVRFREECGRPRPEDCPINIVAEKDAMNMTAKDFVRRDGELGKSYTLWVSAWKPGKPYVDTSMDEFM